MFTGHSMMLDLVFHSIGRFPDFHAAHLWKLACSYRRLEKRLMALTDIVSILEYLASLPYKIALHEIKYGETGDWWSSGHIVYMKGTAEPKF